MGGDFDPIKRAEAWWALIARIITFLGGMALWYYIVASKDDWAYLVGVALTATGLPVAGIVKAALGAAAQRDEES